MAYTKQDWQRLKSELIPVEPENLEQIEEGIVELETRIQAGLGEIETTTTTTVADYSIEKPTEDFKVIEKIPLEEGIVYEVVATVDGVESSYEAELVDGASLTLDYDLTGFKVLMCGDLNDTKGLIVVQDCIAALTPLNTMSAEGYSSIYSSYDKAVIKNAYVNTKATHKVKNQDARYTEAFQSDILCTNETDISFIKNNPIQKELIKTKEHSYKIALDTTNFDLLLDEDDGIKMGYVKDTVLNSKINFEADVLTITLTTYDYSNGYVSETFTLASMSGEEFEFPKNTTVYTSEDLFDGAPIIIRGLTDINFDAEEYVGAVDANGLPLYDADGELVADNNALFILAFSMPEFVRVAGEIGSITINETLAEEVEKEHFKIDDQFVTDFQADFAEGDSSKIGFIKNMPFYSRNKSLPGLTIDCSPTGEEEKFHTGTTKNSLILDKESNYECFLSSITTATDPIYNEVRRVFFKVPVIIYNRAEMLEVMQTEKFRYTVPESEITRLKSVLPADSMMLAMDLGDIWPLIYTHVHMSIADDGTLQVVTDKNTKENYFTYVSHSENINTLINIVGKNIPENNYKIKQIKKLSREFIHSEEFVTDYLNTTDDVRAVTGRGIWDYLTTNIRAQVLSTSDGHINFVKTHNDRNIAFSVETTGIGNNEDLQTTNKGTIVGAINELVDELRDTTQDKIVLKDADTGDLYNLVIRSGQVEIEAITT